MDIEDSPAAPAATATVPPPPMSEARVEKDAAAAAAAAGKARDVTRVVKIIKQNEPLVSEVNAEMDL